MLFFIVISVLFTAESMCEPQVDTTLGAIRGAMMKSRLGGDFFAFRGIRYAEAPVGELRFKNPHPVASWKPDIFDATKDGPMCPQRRDNTSGMSEDCLRLNVYTKDLKGQKPVIVYLHPGGFYSVSGQSKNFAGPQHLMDRNVVLVTLNYRLGTLGFLATGTADAPGNAGLKDQVVALRWVQQHIRNFGGDPNSVTLLGYSAGSFSIALHMLSPMSKGLFHRGIMMSASPLGQFKYEKHQMQLAEKQARLLNCPVKPRQNLVDCLKKKPALDFANTMTDMFEFDWSPILNWMPVIEDDFGQERFLLEDPYETILSGNFYKVPLITGITEFEFIGVAERILKADSLRKSINEEFTKYAPIVLMYERGTPRSEEISSELRSKYLKNATLVLPESMEPLGQLVSDAVIGFEFHRFWNLVSRFTPVYTYLFTYKGRYSHFMYQDQIYGAVHHDELLYLLHVPVMTPLFKQNDPENELIERLTRMWTEFARKGDPNNSNDEYLHNLKWTLYDSNNKSYLQIGNDLAMKEGGIYSERFKIWDDLFPVPQ